jgi:hypothetical protein
MENLNNTLELNNDEYVSQLAFYLKDKLIKVTKLKKKFDIADLDNLKMNTDKVICYIENSEKTSRHKVTLNLKKATN